MRNLYPILILIFLSTAAAAQVPIYNSYPSAPATIYLDFDGHYLQGTSWNINGAIACGPANLNASQITEICNRVAEDYRPFNVNITTDSTKYWSAPATSRIRMVITTTYEWYGTSAGGVAYKGSFTWGDNTPAFVFTPILQYNAKYVAEAVSHEAGHTLGLRHQALYDTNCVYKSDYNPGIGSGEIGWAPIMGSGYYKNFTLWNNGANPFGCVNYQNDLEIITTSNGFGYRADDYGNSFGNNTTKLNFTDNQFSLNGIIERNSDIDVFKITMPSFGRFRLDAVPNNLGDGYTGANLDVQVDLMTDASTVIHTYNAANTLRTSIDTILNAGIYYLRVEGKGNIYASEYASLGSYTLQGSFGSITPLPVRKIELHGRSRDNQHILSWEIDADESVTKQVLEVSTDGKIYQPITNPGASNRSYSYIPASARLLYYRLHITFSNEESYFSNIVSVTNQKNIQPLLVNTVVQNSLSINSSGYFEYLIIDYSGRLVSKGTVVQGLNTISSASLKDGLYFIQLSDGMSLFTQKFIKQ